MRISTRAFGTELGGGLCPPSEPPPDGGIAPAEPALERGPAERSGVGGPGRAAHSCCGWRSERNAQFAEFLPIAQEVRGRSQRLRVASTASPRSLSTSGLGFRVMAANRPTAG